MSRQQIIYRFIAYASEINTNRLKSGKMSSLEWKTLSKTMKMISELPILLMIIKFKFNRYSFKIT
jgi:replicative DNA helicase